MGAVLTEFLEILIGGIETIAGGIGAGAKTAVTELFLETGAEGVLGLSTFGGVVAIFGGIALSIGFVTLIFNWIRTIGN